MQASSLQQPSDDAQVFEDRRSKTGDSRSDGLPERRQFQDSRQYSNPDAGQLAEAIDQYKLTHRRRFITYEELHDVIMSLGYQKSE